MIELAMLLAERTPAHVSESWAPEDCAWRDGAAAPLHLVCAAPNGDLVQVAAPNGFDPRTMERAQAGDRDAMTALGAFYLGSQLGSDPAQALVWLRRAADAGAPLAMSYLADMYFGGYEDFGVPDDDAEAMRLLRSAADLGLPSAMFNLGAVHSLDRGVPPDPAESARWFKMAADHGYSPAMRMLGLLALQGQAKDEAVALRWFQAAADQGDRDAMIELGRLYALGGGFDRDYAKAFRWYRQAADLGDARGQLTVGLMYDSGLGVPEDLVEAARWMRKAADQDLFEACMALEFAYSRGRGVPADEAEARRWRERQEHARFTVDSYAVEPYSDAFLGALNEAEAVVVPYEKYLFVPGEPALAD